MEKLFWVIVDLKPITILGIGGFKSVNTLIPVSNLPVHTILYTNYMTQNV